MEEVFKTELKFNDDLKQEVDEEEYVAQTQGGEKTLNVRNIFAVAFIVLSLIIFIAMIASQKREKKSAANSELDKAGVKGNYEFPLAIENNTSQDTKKANEEPVANEENKKSVDEILDSLPDDFKPAADKQEAEGQAPEGIYAVGQKNKTQNAQVVSSRPETRNSKSPRKIEGLKGQDSYSSSQSIQDAIASSNNAYQSGRITKEEYLAQQMQLVQSIQGNLYGNNENSSNNSQSATWHSNKDSFFKNNSGTGGSGEFLSYNALWDGTIIPAALITAVNTDLPGIVIARVTENVFSSYDASLLLIPEGSLVYATYNNSVSYGQNRIQVAWNLLIRPDGYRIELGNMNGVDSQGMSGYKGFVNNHPFETLKALGIVALYSFIQTEANYDIASLNNEYVQNAVTDVYTEAQKIGNKIVNRALDIQPTITIRAGTEIKLITNMPLVLPPVEVNQATRKYVRTR